MLNNYQKTPIGLTDEEAKDRIKELQKELATLTLALKEQNIPVMILLDGWSATGKGDIISCITSRLEPRMYSVYSEKAAELSEARRPLMWRYWRDIPKRGDLTIFERGWYYDINDASDSDALLSAQTFERQLIDDGYLIFKFFLDVDKDVQWERLKGLMDKKSTSWRVTDDDVRQNKNYDKLRQKRSELLSETNFPFSPWRIVDNNDRYSGSLVIMETVVNGVKQAIKDGVQQSGVASCAKPKLLDMPKLDDVDLSHVIEKKEYNRIIKKEKKKLRKLHSLLYREKIPVVICFEGWDAAGKGGAIRRLSWALDPRGFQTMSIAAPTQEEKVRHYLWRFWTRIQKDGHISIFDRTWYGRVMVERIEGFTPPERWQMAYDEINEFEEELTRWGAVVLKFWVHIDKDTQLARFEERQATPEKQYKITDEDWRNREKWDDYRTAVEEMMERTSTEDAPWIIVEGNDKNHARIQVLRTVREALEKRLGLD